jgi:hypothetical protein
MIEYKRIKLIQYLFLVIVFGYSCANDNKDELSLENDKLKSEISKLKIKNDELKSTHTKKENNQSNLNQRTYESQNQITPSVKEECFRCSGNGNCEECSKVFQSTYWDWSLHQYKSRNETRPGLVMCGQCRGSGEIYGLFNGNKDPEIKECWVCKDGWRNCQKCNSNGNGQYLGKCPDCYGSGYEN